ncbi:hypothetical protein KP806_00705 [Paenibacillus sp. N4]|uniref:hypothetical protein n=1 Tax=Paenibacillus vietnamensis TaxID=2590547 RepID=UPI001CD160B7|nr:hypothetical protein [Paenibacillus vietnamensis]MCA0753554.1 hypothetical protein [Paenibacillus vietnamensis]
MSRSVFIRYFSISAACIAILMLFVLNLHYASPFVRSWDEVDFVLAVDRFDLLAMQPHFPGYPYFIAGAKLIHLWLEDPVQSLIVWNAALAGSAAVPIALLARKYIVAGAAAWVPVCVLSLPYLWLMGSRPMSECAGIAVLWWYLWSVRCAADRPRSNVRLGVALLLFSILMGIRLSYFPFGMALLLLLIFQYRSAPEGSGRLRRLLLALAAGAGAQLVWIGGLVLSEGTLQGFWQLSMAFVAGHFSEWGGGIVSVKMPIGLRFVTLFSDHLIRDVWLSRSAVLAACYGLLIFATGFGIIRLRGGGRQTFSVPKYAGWLLICLAAYAVWVLLGQNIEKPRHIAPVAGPLLLMLFAAALRTAQVLKRPAEESRRSRWNRAAATAIQLSVAAVAAVQVITGLQQLELQAGQQPAVYQLNNYMKEIEEPLVLYTWEETRVLGYLQTDYEHRKVYTFDYFYSLAQADTGRRIFLTDHVLSGFLKQNEASASQVVPVAHFVSDPLLDPVYSEITLYEWKRQDEPK